MYKVAIQKGWPILLLRREELPWDAMLVSEHATPEEAADAVERVQAVLVHPPPGMEDKRIH